jgi:hypothetical protein
MKPEIKGEIVDVLKNSLDAIKNDNIKKLRDLSNKIINSSSLFQDENIIAVAVMTYSLSKVYERTDYRKYPSWNLFNETTINSIKGALFALQNNNFEVFEKNIKNILDVIDRLDNKLKNYVKDTFYNSQIARGSRLHEHGISLGRTAELLGINQWELSDYIGRTGIADVKEGQTVKEDKRLRIARGLFSK